MPEEDDEDDDSVDDAPWHGISRYGEANGGQGARPGEGVGVHVSVDLNFAWPHRVADMYVFTRLLTDTLIRVVCSFSEFYFWIGSISGSDLFLGRLDLVVLWTRKRVARVDQNQLKPSHRANQSFIKQRLLEYRVNARQTLSTSRKCHASKEISSVN